MNHFIFMKKLGCNSFLWKHMPTSTIMTIIIMKNNNKDPSPMQASNWKTQGGFPCRKDVCGVFFISFLIYILSTHFIHTWCVTWQHVSDAMLSYSIPSKPAAQSNLVIFFQSNIAYLNVHFECFFSLQFIIKQFQNKYISYCLIGRYET